MKVELMILEVKQIVERTFYSLKLEIGLERRRRRERSVNFHSGIETNDVELSFTITFNHDREWDLLVKMTTVELPLQLTSHPLSQKPQLIPIQLSSLSYSTTTIGQLKDAITLQWDGNPSKEGLVLILGGRVLKDDLLVEDILNGAGGSNIVSLLP